jgi:predicted MFS family arabinose efflux permease
MRGSISSLRLPGLRRLAGALTLAELGDTLAGIALAVVIFGRSGSVLATGAFFVAARVGPAVASQPLAAFVDRVAGRRGLAACYLAEAALLAGLAWPLPVAALIVVPLATGTIAVCARSVTRAEAAVRLAREGRLREGNGVLNIGFALASTAGAAGGGALCALASPAVALLTASAFFAIGALLVARTQRVRPPADTDGVIAHLREGLAHVRDDRAAMVLIAVQTAALMGFTLVIPVEIVYAERDLGAGAAGYGALLAAWGLGFLVGGALFARARSSLIRLAAISTLSIACAYIGLALAPTLELACVLCLVGGAGNGVQWVAVMTALQERVPDGLQVRVVGLLDAGAQLAPGVGFALGSILTAAVSTRATYALAGSATMVAAVVFYVMHVQETRAPAESVLATPQS